MSFVLDVIKDIIATIKNAMSLGETSKEGRLIVSIVISLLFFFTFLAITGDFWAGAGLTSVLEFLLLYTLSIW